MTNEIFFFINSSFVDVYQRFEDYYNKLEDSDQLKNEFGEHLTYFADVIINTDLVGD
jgi:hypothetical protein